MVWGCGAEEPPPPQAVSRSTDKQTTKQLANLIVHLSVVFFLAGNSSLQIAHLQSLINLLQRHVVQIPVIADIVSIPGMVFVGRLRFFAIKIF
jgi:hypothetical protein